ncbi:MAG: hypothetical protein ACLQIB_37705 [Isosphaeraceae bacterium]
MQFALRQRRLPGSLLWIGAAGLVLIHGGGWIGSGKPADSKGDWRVGSAVSIGVQDGSARFRVPTPGPTSEVLVVVSALSRNCGPFPMRLAVRAAQESSRLVRADDGPRRSPAFVRPARLDPAGPSPPDGMPPSSRSFYLMVKDGDVASASNYTAVTGVLKGVGRRVQVYVALEDVGAVMGETIKDVISSFDDRIYPVAAGRFGIANDVDGDGRFTVLISSWLGHLGGGRYSVDGFVRVADMDPAFRSPFGNHCDMMYLSSGLKPGAHLRTIMAHEYMHAVVYSCKSRCRRHDRSCPIEEEGWLDEAMAHLAEDLHGFSTTNIDYRVNAFLNQPEHYQLVVDDYYAADLFRSHGNRGSTYLFLRWCADRYGPDLLPTLAGSSLRGIANLQASSGATFADLFRRWSVALYSGGLALTDSPPGSPAKTDAVAHNELRAPNEDWELVGPRFTRLTPGSPAHEWSSLGTAAHYVVVDGSRSPYIEIEVSGPREAELQVTCMPLGPDLARLDLAIERSHSPASGLCFRARVREGHGIPVRLSALSWEPLTPSADPAISMGRCGRLDALGVAATFGTTAIPGHGELLSRPIPVTGISPGCGPLVVKVVGTDASGRRVVGWAQLDLESWLGTGDL